MHVLCLSPADNDIDKSILLTMNESELAEIGVKSFGVRRRLKMKIDELKKESCATTSNNSVTDTGPAETQEWEAEPKPVAKMQAKVIKCTVLYGSGELKRHFNQ